MDRISPDKVHFAPFIRQQRAIQRLVRQGRYRNVTDFMRHAIDHYLDRIGRPPLAEQARQMAEDFAQASSPSDHDPSRLQDEARTTDEDW